MTLYYDFSYWEDDLLFAFLISWILKDVGFDIGLALEVQAIHAYLDGSSRVKHYSHIYGAMASPAHHGPQDAT